MVVAGSGERVSSRSIISHTSSIDERSGDLAGQGPCCTPWRARCVAAAVCGHTLSFWKSTSPSCRWTGTIRINNVCNIAGTVYLTLQKDQIWQWIVTDGPSNHQAWGGACVSLENTLRKMMLTRSYAVHVYLHHSHTDRAYSHHWRQQSAIPPSSRLFHDIRLAVLSGVVV